MAGNQTARGSHHWIINEALSYATCLVEIAHHWQGKWVFMRLSIVTFILRQERFSTSAALLDIGVVEDELGTERILFPIHLRSNDAEQRFTVH